MPKDLLFTADSLLEKHGLKDGFDVLCCMSETRKLLGKDVLIIIKLSSNVFDIFV